MKSLKISLEELKDMISKHKAFIVNYGKGYLSDDDVKEYSYWDDSIKAYRSESGIWNLKLLYSIAKGEVLDTSIERMGD